MNNHYIRSLVPVHNYLDTASHKLYIYPQPREILDRIPDKYKQYFPDMDKNIQKTVDQYYELDNKKDMIKYGKDDRFFDCRMCAYFSKCVFKSKHMTYKELVVLNIDAILQNSLS